MRWCMRITVTTPHAIESRVKITARNRFVKRGGRAAVVWASWLASSNREKKKEPVRS